MPCLRVPSAAAAVILLAACGTSPEGIEPARARAPALSVPGAAAAQAGTAAGTRGPVAAATDAERPFEGARGSPDYRARVVATPLSSSPAPGWEPERLWSSRVDWEPVVAVDPSSNAVYQLAARYYASPCPGCPDPSLVFRRSEDGGRTWQADEFPFRGGRTQVDAQLRVSSDGTLFAAWLQDWRPGVSFARSRDGGRSWSEPISFAREIEPHWSDHPLLLVSPDGRTVVLAFNNGHSWIATSHDGGRTFGRPVRTDRDERYWFHTGGVIDGRGEIFIAAVDYSQSYRGPAHVNILRSSDGGVTWRARRVDTAAEAPACEWIPGCYVGFLGPRADLAIDADGTMLLVYNAGTRDGGPQGLWLRRSRDGRHWSRRRRVGARGADVDHAFPVLAAGAAAGDLRLAWQDDRRGRWNTWYRRSLDGGRHWGRVARLSGSGPTTDYKDARGYLFPYGDYLSIAVGPDGTAHVVWGAGESFNGNGGVWYTRGR